MRSGRTQSCQSMPPLMAMYLKFKPGFVVRFSRFSHDFRYMRPLGAPAGKAIRLFQNHSIQASGNISASGLLFPVIRFSDGIIYKRIVTLPGCSVIMVRESEPQ